MLFKRMGKGHGLRVRKGFYGLLGLLLLVSLWSGWIFFRPYDSEAPKDAICKVLRVGVKRDKSYYWVRSYWQASGDAPLPQSILLVSTNRKIRSADCVREGKTDFISFYVEEGDLQGKCSVELNGVSYLLKNDGIFSLEDKQEKVFRTADWK